MIKLENVNFSYNNREVLKDINLTIQEGELIGILGPNGSGKTTLLKVLAGILHPKAGKVLIKGKFIKHYKDRERAKLVGYVPQYIPSYFQFTVYEAVMSGRYPHLGPFNIYSNQDKEVVERSMELVDVHHISNRKLTDISSGERQRVAIAACLAQDTDIILLDEPISNLDIHYQRKILNTLYSLNKEHQKTIIIVFHDINMAFRFCDKIFFLKNGSLIDSKKTINAITEDIIEDIFETSVVVLETRNNRIFLPDLISTNEQPLTSLIEEDKQLTENFLIGGFIHEIKKLLQDHKMILDSIYKDIPNHFNDSMERIINFLNNKDIDQLISNDIRKIIYNNSLLLKIKKHLNICLKKIDRVISLSKTINSYTNLQKNFSDVVNINELLREIYESNFETFLKNSIKLDVHIEDNCTLKINRQHMRTILENLILNSINVFKSENIVREKKRIIIRSFTKKNKIYIQLEDNGPGIKEEYLSNIFKPFSTKKSKEIDGFRLFLVNRLVKLYGGRIYATSIPKKGTTFHIVFSRNLDKTQEIL